MCGIFGFAGDARAARGVPLERAVRALRHRGPDGEGIYLGDSANGRTACALAHTRLAILDVSDAAAQPMSTGDGRFTLVYNGEIYNFAELRSELERAGKLVRSSGDTEIVLRAYEHWGRSAFRRLRGMFAIAVWDALEGTLILCRDRLGIKPLYYLESASGLAFSSEVRALLATGQSAARISPLALRSYLQNGTVAEPYSILDGVYVAPPGAILTYRDRALAAEAFWRLPEQSRRALTFKDAVEELRPTLHEAVQLHLVSDVPLGIFLSGGVDSSSLVGLAAAAASAPVHTFTVSFDDEDYTEERYAAEVAAHFGCDHHQVHLPASRAAADVPIAWEHADRPSADGLNTFFVAEAARQAGLRVALSGLGGDELFAGYEGFRRFGAYLRMGRLAHALPKGLVRHGDNARSPWETTNRVRKLVSVLQAGGDVAATYRAMRGMFLGSQVDSLLGQAPTAKGSNAFEPSVDGSRTGDAINAFSELELQSYMRDTLLRDADNMSMAHSLEVRVPLLDHRLVEQVIAIPGSLKLHKRLNKPLLVAAAPHLPPAVVRRPKMGFVLPFERWFRGPMSTFLSDLFLSGSAGAGLLDRRALVSLWTAFLKGPQYVSYSRIACLAALLVWSEARGAELGAAAAHAPVELEREPQG